MIQTPPRRLAAALLALCAVASVRPAPASETAPAIGQVLRVSVGADRSTVTVATLAAPEAGEAVFWTRGAGDELVVRTGEPVRPSGGPAFELRAIGRAWAAPEALLYLGTTVEGPPVLVRHDAGGSRLLAIGPDPGAALVAPEGRPTVGTGGCTLELEVFELLGAGAAPLGTDGSVRFPAWLGPPCEEARANVRFHDGRYAVESLTVAPGARERTGAIELRTLVPPWRVPGGDRLEVAAGAVGVPDAVDAVRPTR